MSKISLKRKKLIYRDNAFISIFLFELLYIFYTYIIADNISIKIGADGFLKDNIFVLPQEQIFISVFLVPPFEELIARTFLNKELKYFNVTFLFLFLTTFIFYFYSKLFSLIFLSTIIILLLIELYKGYGFLKKVARNNFISFFILFSFLFAFVHIPVISSTYTDLSFIVRLIVITFSIFPFAIILGIIRLKYGLKYSIFLHILNNGLILLLNGFIYS